MASTCSQILTAIMNRIEAISIPDADKFDSCDAFQGVIGVLPTEVSDRCFALQPSVPERSTRYVTTPQMHTVNVVLMVVYKAGPEAWIRAVDDGSRVTEALWSCISGASAVPDLEHIEMGPGQIRLHGNNVLVAERQLVIDWRTAD